MKTGVFSAVLAAFLMGFVALAQAQELGPVTNLPIPRFVSMKATEGNVRRGPSLSHRIDWVYTRKDLPLIITAEYGHWRRIEDRDGQGGWVHYSLLSGVRTVLVESEATTMHTLPDEGAPQVAILKRGVVARIDECRPDWCRVHKAGSTGWVNTSDLWGVAPGEVIE